jgi:hypothetical protein
MLVVELMINFSSPSMLARHCTCWEFFWRENDLQLDKQSFLLMYTA